MKSLNLVSSFPGAEIFGDSEASRRVPKPGKPPPEGVLGHGGRRFPGNGSDGDVGVDAFQRHGVVAEEAPRAEGKRHDFS